MYWKTEIFIWFTFFVIFALVLWSGIKPTKFLRYACNALVTFSNF